MVRRLSALAARAPWKRIRPAYIRASELVRSVHLKDWARLEHAAILLLVAGSLGLAITSASSARGHTVMLLPGHSTVPPTTAPLRYRAVGCLRRGPPIAYTGGPHRKLVALSFDDGPGPLTGKFVRMLSENGAVATFFMIGRQLTGAYRATLHSELAAGDALGDHTWSHPDLVRSGAVRSELGRTLEAIRGLSGYSPCVFRPPYGSYDSSVLFTARSLGLATIMWDVDPADYTLPGTGAIVRRVLAQVKPGSIILSHDGGGPRGQTLAAYPPIIRALRHRGYRFLTVPQLLGFRTIYRRCVRDCKHEAITGKPAPGSIIEPGS
jgi:peptidoglycan-N-acetylglucosamine deacetylase